MGRVTTRPQYSRTARQRRSGQRERQPAEPLKLALRAPPRHSPVDASAPTLEFSQICAIPASLPVNGIERPESCGDQNILEARPPGERPGRFGRPHPSRCRCPEPASLFLLSSVLLRQRLGGAFSCRQAGVLSAMRKAPVYLAAIVLAISALVAAAAEPGRLVPGDRFRLPPAPLIEAAPVEPTIALGPAKRPAPLSRAPRARAQPAQHPATPPGDGRVQF